MAATSKTDFFVRLLEAAVTAVVAAVAKASVDWIAHRNRGVRQNGQNCNVGPIGAERSGFEALSETKGDQPYHSSLSGTGDAS